ncbi:DnaJ domain-containing protein [Paracoccus sp. Z118]|uniref:DnaJ C-terminal domain-containing protein n=1 Tax=Paracoccus sp. Z118 TaxID=2851017 RepID=UPI001C2C1209|nr:DnaJ C-terminal domain-containing protein [Paracoccus sp. Z118]MBV0893005.1 DnaJ domain-containing protein [Paracoccus sp. Z118]
MADDPYAALGVAKTASDAEIKKAYRRIAKTDHPDLNSDPAAQDRFKAAAAAYDLLKDPEQRARFDRGEIDAQGQERPQRRYYRDFAEAGDNPYTGPHRGQANYGDFSDVFEDLFGGRAEARAGRAGGRWSGGAGSFDMRGADHRYNLEVDFMTAARGGTTRITLPDGHALDVQIPAGTRDGQTIRLRGKGGPGMGNGQPGDALLTISVADDPDWRRNGDDIETTLAISLDEAVLGGKVEAQTIDGPVMLTVPKGASGGQRLRLRGRGLKRANGTRGDHHVELKIVMPPRIDDELAQFITRWREDHAYDPRKGGA